MKKSITLLLFLFWNLVFAGQPPAPVVAKNNSSKQEFYVTKDVGNDANDCSRFRPCKTIQTGINQANLVSAYYKQTIVHVAPSPSSANYAENLTLSQQGVNLQCDNPVSNSRACTVSGSLTVNLTGTSGGANFIAASNEVYVNGFVFSNGASTALLFSGTTFQRLVLVNCYFQTSTVTAANISNSGVNGVNSTAVAYDTTFENNSASNATVIVSAGRFWTYGTTSTLQNDTASGTSLSVTGPSNIITNFTQLVGQVSVTDNTATVTFNLSTIASGTNPCIITPSSPSTGYALLAYYGCNSSNANSVTGSGVVVFATGNACIGTACSTASTIITSSLGRLPEGTTYLQFATGALTSLSTNEIVGSGKTVRAIKIENVTGAAAVFTTCTTNPTMTLYDCGTSAGACTSGRTALANVTISAANTITNGTVTSSTLAAGHYWAWEVTAGACAALNATGSSEAAQQ